MLDKTEDSDVRDCVVKLLDDHGVEHSARIRPKSVYEAALRGLERLQNVGRESDGSQIGTVVVEVHEEPTRHTVNVKKLLDWLKQPGKYPRDELRKEKLRALVKRLRALTRLRQRHSVAGRTGKGFAPLSLGFDRRLASEGEILYNSGF